MLSATLTAVRETLPQRRDPSFIEPHSNEFLVIIIIIIIILFKINTTNDILYYTRSKETNDPNYFGQSIR